MQVQAATWPTCPGAARTRPELLDFGPRDAITRHEQSYNRVIQQIAQYRFFVAVPATRHGALLQAIIRRNAVFTAFARPAARARPAVMTLHQPSTSARFCRYSSRLISPRA